MKIIKTVLPALLWMALILPAHADVIYTIEDGDSAWSIAIRFGISLEVLYEANGWAEDENPVLQIGQKIAIPSDRELIEPESDDEESGETTSESTYIVQDGDTFSLIAQSHGVGTIALIQYNGLTVDDFIRPGQLLSIPPGDFEPQSIEVITNDKDPATTDPDPTETPATPEPVHYRVQANDTPWGIARQFGINLTTLLAYNNLDDDAVLQVGMELLVPVEAGSLSSRSLSLNHHTVIPGDTLGGIAVSYGTSADVVANANNISTESILREGQELIIPVYRSAPTTEPAEEPAEEPAVVSTDPVMVDGPTCDNPDGLTTLPDLNDAELLTGSGTNLAGWHSDIFDFSQIETPEPSSDDPMLVTDSGLSIDGYFEDSIPYHLYTIRRGDTLGDVAGEFGVTQSQLRNRNGLDDRSTLRIGRDLKVPMPMPTTPPSNSNSGTSGTTTWGAPDIELSDSEGTATGRAVVEEASKYLGTRYVYGGNSLTGGIDCSGFTCQIYSMFGISLYRSARDQATNGDEVGYDEMEPGDIVCFHTTRPGISHVGMYIGNGDFIHSSSARSGIVISPLDSGYYNERFVCARRVLD